MGMMLTMALLGIPGVLLFVLGLRRIWRRKMVSGGLQGLSGALLITLALLLASIIANLHTYLRLNHEAEVATLQFDQLGPQRYRALLSQGSQPAEILELQGDEWQLDARVLKWRGFANLLGLDAGYQLERLSGRYRDVQQAQQKSQSVHGLNHPQGIDIWQLARQYPRWLPWVDAVYGSATYMPMVHGARYQISLSQSGLLARPMNEVAKQALQSWK